MSTIKNLAIELPESNFRGFAQYASQRKTAIPYLGILPAHWREDRLKHVASVRFSSVDKKSEEGEEQVRLCNYTDVYNNVTVATSASCVE